MTTIDWQWSCTDSCHKNHRTKAWSCGHSFWQRMLQSPTMTQILKKIMDRCGVGTLDRVCVRIRIKRERETWIWRVGCLFEGDWAIVGVRRLIGLFGYWVLYLKRWIGLFAGRYLRQRQTLHFLNYVQPFCCTCYSSFPLRTFHFPCNSHFTSSHLQIPWKVPSFPSSCLSYHFTSLTFSPSLLAATIQSLSKTTCWAGLIEISIILTTIRLVLN